MGGKAPQAASKPVTSNTVQIPPGVSVPPHVQHLTAHAAGVTARAAIVNKQPSSTGTTSIQGRRNQHWTRSAPGAKKPVASGKNAKKPVPVARGHQTRSAPARDAQQVSATACVLKAGQNEAFASECMPLESQKCPANCTSSPYCEWTGSTTTQCEGVNCVLQDNQDPAYAVFCNDEDGNPFSTEKDCLSNAAGAYCQWIGPSETTVLCVAKNPEMHDFCDDAVLQYSKDLCLLRTPGMCDWLGDDQSFMNCVADIDVNTPHCVGNSRQLVQAECEKMSAYCKWVGPEGTSRHCVPKEGLDLAENDDHCNKGFQQLSETLCLKKAEYCQWVN